MSSDRDELLAAAERIEAAFNTGVMPYFNMSTELQDIRLLARHVLATLTASGPEPDRVAAAVAAEREACVKECGELYAKWVHQSLQLRFTDQQAAKDAAAKTFACHEIAAAIRARGPCTDAGAERDKVWREAVETIFFRYSEYFPLTEQGEAMVAGILDEVARRLGGEGGAS